MHLCLKQAALKGKFLDLLLTDLPGEWTDNLIKSDKGVAPFEFLQRANGILYVVDGPQISKRSTKHLQIYQATLALDRLTENLKLDKRVPITLVVSKCDEIDMKCPEGILSIKEHAEKRGITASVVLTAAVSRKPDQIPSGKGVMESIKSAITPFSPLEKQIFFDEEVYPQRSFWKRPLY